MAFALFLFFILLPSPTWPSLRQNLLLNLKIPSSSGKVRFFFSKGDTEKALWRFKRLTTDYPNSPLFNEAKFRMGICYTQLKRPKDAIRVLNELLSTFLAPARMIQVFTLMGDNYLELKDPFNALHWYGKGLLVQGQPEGGTERQGEVDYRHIRYGRGVKQGRNPLPGGLCGRLCKISIRPRWRGAGATAALLKKIVTELEKEYQGMDYLSQARELLGPLPVSEKSKYTIGVILPLSGIHQPFGTRVLQAIQLAIKEANPPGKIAAHLIGHP